MEKPKSQSLFFFFLCSPLKKNPWTRDKVETAANPHEHKHKPKQKPHEPGDKPNRRTHEPRRRTQATKPTNSGDKPMNLGGETHEPKLGLNSRTCMIPSGEGRFEFSLYSLFYISAEQELESLILEFH